MLHAVQHPILYLEDIIMRHVLSSFPMLLVLTGMNLFFEALCSFEYSYDKCAIPLGQLYQNWHHVVAHLRLTDRIKAFKYHMKEVIFVSEIPDIVVLT